MERRDGNERRRIDEGLSRVDLMARLAGMVLRHRWSDWQGSPFTASSTNHVSVYELY